MKKVEHDLLTNKYTEVCHEPPEEMNYNAPHSFYVSRVEDGKPLAEIHFQEGPIKWRLNLAFYEGNQFVDINTECGVNGVCNEDLIAMVITRLEHFQKSEFACRENALAITKLEESLLWLRKRTMGRERRGVEGTHVK